MTHFFSALGVEPLLKILQQSGDPTAMYTGPEFTIQFANDAILAIWGKDESVIGHRFENALPEIKGQPFADLLKQVWESKEIYEANEMPATLDIHGEPITSYFNFTFKPILNKEGDIYCILHTAKDVTELIRTRDAVLEKEIKEEEIKKELRASNEGLRSNNQELYTLNKEYTVTNEKLGASNKIIQDLNLQIKKENNELLSGNRKFQDDITNLGDLNKNLASRNQELKDLNDTITQLNNKLSESDISFTNLIDQAPVAIMLLKGDDFVITMINDAMLALIEKDYSVIGKSLFEVLPELKGQPAAEMLIKTYRMGTPNSDHSNPVILNRDGQFEERYFTFNYTPFIEDGKVTGVIDMAVEVTTQVMAIQERESIIIEKSVLEETLRKSEQRLQGILETMAEGVGVIDATGQLVYANPMAQQILGLSESKIKERTYDDPKWQNLRLDGTLLPSEEHPMSIMMSTQKPVYDHEVGVKAPERDIMYISINAAPLFDDEGNLTGGIGTFMDVTTRRMITQGKEDFISIASHELKTPVTALKASLQLLQRSHDRLPPESRAKLLDQSIKSLDKLSGLINSLLDTSRIEQGQLKLDKRPFTISELFDDCCSNFSQITDQEIIFEGDIYEQVMADNQQIGQVMINFISNAIKYAPESKQVIITAKKISDHEIKISVRDQGPGIPKEKLEHLFKRYYRTNYHGQKFTGLGLGLFISGDIIKEHGGRIGVESEEGKGSEFWFTLPI
ncbi:PAS domain-containing protein [uncultured Chryseobacterium sp.]|uniref:PAS domain-containing protein n=1 Tax=uncultured Chryseobacterium sp. TaxID=259322 RepID=UPI0025D6F0DC|nr:PAS domain-containing protein [uncultured Chryseobacterium sp.]